MCLSGTRAPQVCNQELQFPGSLVAQGGVDHTLRQ